MVVDSITIDSNPRNNRIYKIFCSACEEGPGLCALAMTVLSLFFIIITLPLSMLFVVKVVQEYERAVIFRLGRLLTGGARGPGVFFVIPCVDIYEKIDMRSQTFEIPPQEVETMSLHIRNLDFFLLDFNQGFSDGVCQCYHVLQSEECHSCCSQCG